ncbi:hypothetical protein C8R43DRAFT_352953 [Mycena crocata]|nr:hypothetical protein C8R43DRAFT_352953 [Mycena crocata]
MAPVEPHAILMPLSSSPITPSPPTAPTHPQSQSYLPSPPSPDAQTPLLSPSARSTAHGDYNSTETRSRIPRIGPSLVLENTGSVARDHLANERTFLAYVRTSLTIASAGVALAQLLTLSEPLKSQLFVSHKPLEVYARPLAVSAIVLALYVLFVGVSRFFAIQSALTRGLFPVTRARLGVIALGLAGIISLLFGLLVAERARAR